MASDNYQDTDNRTSQETRKIVFSLKQTQESAWKTSQNLTAFNGNLVSAIEAQKGSPLDYGSEFWDINRIKTYSVTTQTNRG